MDRLEPIGGRLAVCAKCKRFKLVTMRFYWGNRSAEVCTQCGGDAAIYLKQHEPAE